MIERESIRDRVSDEDDQRQLRAAVYARTSTGNQKFGYSLTAQVNRCIDRCQSLGWEVRFVYRDEAESGKDTDRPMFQQMLKMVERDAFDVVVFWKLDRFSRSLMHAVQLESDLREHDVYLYSVTEQIDTTSATGRFNFRNIASAAEFERDMIRQRTQMGLNELASECKWPNDSPPLGYVIASDGRLEIVENERQLVTDIFEMYIENRSMPDVAETLNDQEIQTKEGQKWTPRAVGDILRNKIYIGQYEVGDISKHVDDYQIIENEKFERVSDIRHRFRDGDGSRKQMPETRKERITQEVREKYQEYLGIE